MFSVSDLKKTKVYQEARQEGREEGLIEGVRRVAKEMLASGMSIQQVQEMTKLSSEEIQRLTDTKD